MVNVKPAKKDIILVKMEAAAAKLTSIDADGRRKLALMSSVRLVMEDSQPKIERAVKRIAN